MVDAPFVVALGLEHGQNPREVRGPSRSHALEGGNKGTMARIRTTSDPERLIW
jgi:hypothetical protein